LDLFKKCFSDVSLGHINSPNTRLRRQINIHKSNHELWVNYVVSPTDIRYNLVRQVRARLIVVVTNARLGR
jgi:hypothetical protein